MSTKLKYTAILACSVALISIGCSSARAQGRFTGINSNIDKSNLDYNSGESGTKTDTKPNSDSIRGAADASASVLNTDGAETFQLNTTNSTNATSVIGQYDDLQKIFDDSIAKIEKKKEALLTDLDQKYEINVDSHVRGKKGAGAAQAAVQARLTNMSSNYIDTVSKNLTGVYRHLRGKVLWLNDKINEANNKEILAITRKAEARALKYVGNVEGKASEYYGNVERNFTMEAISGNAQLDKLIHESLGGSASVANLQNTTNSSDMESTARIYILNDAPTLQITR